jgi:hypothetical protein
MADNLNEHSEHIIGLTELMVQTLEATIEADRSTADEYFRILEENSFEEGNDGSKELQMVDVRLSNSNGQTQILSVPKMILMPIPMLHISEASFELEGNMCLNTTEETKVEAEKTGEVSLEDLKKSRQVKGISAPRLRKQSLRIMLPTSTKTSGESGTSTENSQTTTNVKISMKLTQSDMPSGLVNLLQVITNNIQLKNE